MIVALGGAIFEALRDQPPRWELLTFYACLLGLGTAVPAARSLFGSTNQEQPAESAPVLTATGPVSLERRSPRNGRRRGGGGTTR